MRARAIRALGLAISLSWAIGACGTGSNTAAPPKGSSSSIHWLIAASALRKIAGNPETVKALQPSLTTIIVHDAEPVPSAWTASAKILSFPSYRALMGTIPHLGHVAHLIGIGYDNERWPLTPNDEKIHAALFERRFFDRVHQMGLQYWQLGNLPSVGGSNYGGARWATVLDVQIQHAERNPARYRRLLVEAIGQIRRFNPHTQIIAGLSTNPSGGPVTARMLYQDIMQTRSMVAGYWLNIPGPGVACPRCAPSDPAVADTLLAWLAGSSTPPLSSVSTVEASTQ